MFPCHMSLYLILSLLANTMNSTVSVLAGFFLAAIAIRHRSAVG